MKSDLKKLEKGQLEITVEITPEEYQPFLEKAAKKIAESAKIDGFRPGKASYELIVKKVGKNEVWQQAIEPAIHKTFVEVLQKEDLKTVGQPRVDIVKLAPDNPVVYKAVVDVLPEVEVGDLSKISVSKKEIKIDEERLKKTLEDLRKMRAKETLVDRKSKEGDKMEINFEVFLDKVPIDNGRQEKFPLVIGEKSFIPGFEEQLIGLAKDEEKTFQLEFPKNYHQKNLAGRLADFKVKVNAVYEMDLPELNDDLAKQLGGFNSIKDVEEEIKTNLKAEEEQKENHRLEDEMITKIIEKSKFDDIPDTLVNAEASKMVEELAHNISHQGIKFEDYLTHLKKTKEDLLLDFTPQAVKRVKSALILRKIGEQEKIDVSENEVDEEVQKVLAAYGGNPEAEKQINSLQYRTHIKNGLISQKIVDHLKAKMVK